MLSVNKLKPFIGLGFYLSFCLLLSSCVTPCAWKGYDCSAADFYVDDSSEKEISITLRKNETVELVKDQVVKVNLEANPTTGYSWEVSKKDDEGVLSQVGETEYMAGSQAKEKVVGAGGFQIYRFQALKKGTATLIFEYKRSWEKDQMPARKYILEVIVK